MRILTSGRLVPFSDGSFSKRVHNSSKAPQQSRGLGTAKRTRGGKIQAVYTKEEAVADFVKFKPPLIDIRDVLSGTMPSSQTVQKVRTASKCDQVAC